MKKIIQLFIALILISCSSPSNSKEKIDYYFGTIINKSTNLPSENISINLFRYKLYNDREYSTLIDTFFTDNEGKFYIDKSNFDDEFMYEIWVNFSPLNSEFTTISSALNLEVADLGKFYIHEFTNLRVEVKLTSDTLDCSLIEISMPRYSTFFWYGTDTVYSGRALGNKYNIISLKCALENNEILFTDSVFCPLNQETSYSIKY